MIMKKVLFILSLVASVITQAQVAVGTSAASMNASAQLEITSNTKGFLPPRMTQAQRNGIASPAQGLMVYCTDCGTVGQAQVFNGSAWTNILGGSASGLAASLPTFSVQSLNVSEKTFSTATYGASSVSVTSPDGSLLSKGVCWSINPNPTLSDYSTSIPISVSGLRASLTNLTPNTTYYVRPYGTNNAGTSYGTQESFTTSTLAIGDKYGGGLVLYVNKSGDVGYDANVPHGVIISDVDVPNGAATYAETYKTPQINVNYDFEAICNNWVYNGYDDWVFPGTIPNSIPTKVIRPYLTKIMGNGLLENTDLSDAFDAVPGGLTGSQLLTLSNMGYLGKHIANWYIMYKHVALDATGASVPYIPTRNYYFTTSGRISLHPSGVCSQTNPALWSYCDIITHYGILRAVRPF
jgi:hypothetical protein